MDPAPTYHVDIWTTPPSYVCLLCMPTQRYTLEAVTAHLTEVHHTEAIPTPGMDELLKVRTDADARAAADAAAEVKAGTPVEMVPQVAEPGTAEVETAAPPEKGP